MIVDVLDCIRALHRDTNSYTLDMIKPPFLSWDVEVNAFLSYSQYNVDLRLARHIADVCVLLTVFEPDKISAIDELLTSIAAPLIVLKESIEVGRR